MWTKAVDSMGHVTAECSAQYTFMIKVRSLVSMMLSCAQCRHLATHEHVNERALQP